MKNITAKALSFLLIMVFAASNAFAGSLTVINSSIRPAQYKLIAGDNNCRQSHVIFEEELASRKQKEFQFRFQDIYPYDWRGNSPYYEFYFAHGWLKINLTSKQDGELVVKNLELIDSDNKDIKYIGQAKVSKMFNNGEYEVNAEVTADGSVIITICAAHPLMLG